jgi:lactoylglutathione lyase
MKYVIIYVSNFEESLAFYCNQLGLSIRNNHGSYIELDTGNTILAMILKENVSEMTGLPTPSDISSQTFELGFVTEDVIGVVEKLRENGVKIIKEPIKKPWGQTVAYVADPDQHYIEICSPIE